MSPSLLPCGIHAQLSIFVPSSAAAGWDSRSLDASSRRYPIPQHRLGFPRAPPSRGPPPPSGGRSRPRSAPLRPAAPGPARGAGAQRRATVPEPLRAPRGNPAGSMPLAQLAEPWPNMELVHLDTEVSGGTGPSSPSPSLSPAPPRSPHHPPRGSPPNKGAPGPAGPSRLRGLRSPPRPLPLPGEGGFGGAGRGVAAGPGWGGLTPAAAGVGVCTAWGWGTGGCPVPLLPFAGFDYSGSVSGVLLNRLPDIEEKLSPLKAQGVNLSNLGSFFSRLPRYPPPRPQLLSQACVPNSDRGPVSLCWMSALPSCFAFFLLIKTSKPDVQDGAQHLSTSAGLHHSHCRIKGQLVAVFTRRRAAS